MLSDRRRSVTPRCPVGQAGLGIGHSWRGRSGRPVDRADRRGGRGALRARAHGRGVVRTRTRLGRHPAGLVAGADVRRRWLQSFDAQFSVAIVVRDDGSLAVTERIVEDFGAFARHGIERVIPEVEDPVDGSGKRLFEVTDLEVSTSAGTPGDVTLSTTETDLTIRIGDPDTTITGVHAYRLRYVVPAGVTETDPRSVCTGTQ